MKPCGKPSRVRGVACREYSLRIAGLALLQQADGIPQGRPNPDREHPAETRDAPSLPQAKPSTLDIARFISSAASLGHPARDLQRFHGSGALQ